MRPRGVDHHPAVYQEIARTFFKVRLVTVEQVQFEALTRSTLARGCLWPLFSTMAKISYAGYLCLLKTPKGQEILEIYARRP